MIRLCHNLRDPLLLLESNPTPFCFLHVALRGASPAGPLSFHIPQQRPGLWPSEDTTGRPGGRRHLPGGPCTLRVPGQEPCSLRHLYLVTTAWAGGLGREARPQGSPPGPTALPHLTRCCLSGQGTLWLRALEPLSPCLRLPRAPAAPVRTGQCRRAGARSLCGSPYAVGTQQVFAVCVTLGHILGAQ